MTAGAKTKTEFIPVSVPNIGGNEWAYVKECLDSGWVSSVGSYVDKFEESICDYTGAKHAVACVNGTAALHISLKVAGVTPGDEVIVPTLTFIASVNAVKYAGAEPIFMDCDDYYNIDVVKTIDFIENETVFKDGFTYNKKTDRRIAVIVPVHVLGNAADIDPLLDVCGQRNIKVVEDAAESLGTYYTKGQLNGKHTGTVGDIGVYSFNGNKIITCGGGGMIVTDNDEYAKRAKYLTTQAKDDPVEYIHHDIGYNYRLTNVLAAIGVAQMEQLPAFINSRRTNYDAYKAALDDIEGLAIADVPGYARNNCWMYALQINIKEYGLNRDQLLRKLSENMIQARPIWSLSHQQTQYRDCQTYRIEKSVELHEETLCIPCSSCLKQEDIERVIAVLRGGR